MSDGIHFPETRAEAAEQLADRYMALWNEPDAERRRRMIAELWTEEGSQILQPPQEMREIAESPGIGLAATRADTASPRRGRRRPSEQPPALVLSAAKRPPSPRLSR